MNVLLDECLPRKLKRELAGDHVTTVPEKRWASIKNGALLRLAEAVFDVFITADQNLQYQQNLHSTAIGIIVLVAPNTRFDTLTAINATCSSGTPHHTSWRCCSYHSIK